ncbi:MAG: threonine dehydratase, partial [Gammaproteobacteria bacterium]|nr:threonine dehydratase [Gammaproteobacteria bacterium]
MPELPEVETTRRGVEPHVVGQCVRELRVHEARLRWKVAADLP